MKLTSMKAALAVMSAGMVLVSCGNEGPNLKGNLKMDRDTLLIQAVWQKKSLLDTVVLKNGHFETTIPDSVCFIYLFPKPKSEDEMITMCPKRILFLPGDKMTVSGDVYAPEVSGTELYDALNRQTEMKETEREWLDKVQERNIKREPANIASAYAAIFLPEKESIEAYGMLDESAKNSAIAPAIMTGYIMKLPVVFAKKKKPSTMLDLVRQAGAELAGMGFIIEKEFQHGRDVLAEAGVRVESLAIIESLGNCTIKIRQ